MLFFSTSGDTLPVVYRLRREGVDAGIYLHNPQYRGNYEGIIPKITAANLKRELKNTDIVVFDIVRPNEKAKYDIILLKMFGLKPNLPSVFGPVADKLKKDHRVIGAAAATEEIELDRSKGTQLAEKMGFAIPETHRFKTLTEGVVFLKGRKDKWVFKPENNQDLDLTYVEKFTGELAEKMQGEYQARIGDNCDYILQKKIDGTEISTEVWVNTKGPVHFNRTIESKRFMDGNKGPSIGSQSNTVWIEKDHSTIVVPMMVKMAQWLKSAGYIGPCDANCIISEGKPYFLEWTPRLGYDALFCLLTLLSGSITDFFKKDFDVNFSNGFAASERLTIPPFPYAVKSLRDDFAKDVSIMGNLTDYPFFWAQDIYSSGSGIKCAGSDGILGAVTAKAPTLQEAWGRLHNAIKKIKVCSYLQYRQDGLKEAEKRLKGLKVA